MLSVSIKSCFECPLRKQDSDGMYCSHPFLNSYNYENMIITQQNIKSFPDECPLQKGLNVIKTEINII